MDTHTYNQLSQYLTSKKVIFGITNTRLTSFKDDYSHALIYGVPHTMYVDLSSYRESLLEGVINQCKKDIDEVEVYIEKLFKSNQIYFFKPPIAQDNEIDLIAQFSFKDAAASAGLGWIGKNDLLINEKYGPRIRLGAVLFNSSIAYSSSNETISCPDNCSLCVIACPFKLLAGVKWRSGIKREDIVNFTECNQQRSKYIEKHHRKNSCGLCLVACPIGSVYFRMTTASP